MAEDRDDLLLLIFFMALCQYKTIQLSEIGQSLRYDICFFFISLLSFMQEELSSDTFDN